ncbi:GntR family transcriptional regulator [Novosphingobium sp. FSW06-99]|nr:GntR family transcriptional regulator [Novosphingobium sp. FSW06-99]
MPSSPAGDPEMSSARVFRGIMRDLEEGRLVPGQILAETSLAAQYGVGRNAVREAMQHLAARGVVDLSRNRSPTIRRLDLAETHEILAVASAMTALAAQAAARGYDPVQHADLIATTLDALAQADLIDEPGMFSRARRHFYRVLLRIGANRELQRLYPAVSMHIIYAQYQSRRLRGIRLADYRAIMDAVTRGDVAGAEVAARTHVEHVRTAIEQMHAAAPDRAVLKDGTTAPPS